jgi:5-methylcytosine-specific restriction endonuclease McrA
MAQYEAQGRRCYYTGGEIEWGVNASIDHVVPRSKGGTDAADNIRIVHITVNKAKNALDEGEFLAMCRLVAARFPKGERA